MLNSIMNSKKPATSNLKSLVEVYQKETKTNIDIWQQGERPLDWTGVILITTKM